MPMFLSTAEVARVLGVSDQTVVKRCKENELKHIKFGKSFLVDKEAFERLIGRKLPGGEEHNS